MAGTLAQPALTQQVGAPPVSAIAALLVDAQSGRELWSKEPDRRMFPASTTKIMTGLLAAEAGDLDRIVTVSPLAASVSESSIALQPNERISVRDLLLGCLIWSANDASTALAEAVAGSVPAFVDRMNQRARELGADHTHFANPHGLHDPNHYTTARDLAAIAVEAMRNDEFRQIVGTREVILQRPTWVPLPQAKGQPVSGAQPSRRLEVRPQRFTNRNRLLLGWPACDGIKTGYTRHAGRCLVASTSREGCRFISVVLHSTDSTGDSRRLLEWALQNHEVRTLAWAGQTAPGWLAPVTDGRSRHVPLVPATDLTALVRKGKAAPSVVLEATPIVAPVTAGAAAGVLRAVEGQSILGEVQLVAQTDVPLSLWGRAKRLPLGGLSGRIILCVAAGVLLLGTAAKAARPRRRSVPASRGTTDTRRPSLRGREDRRGARGQGRPRYQRNRG